MLPLISTESTAAMARINSMQREIRTLQNNMGGLVRADGQPHFQSFTADSGYFYHTPLNYAYVISTSVQSIATGVQTALQFDEIVDLSGEPTIKWSSAASSEINLAGRLQNHGFLAWGHVQFDTNSSGSREVGLKRHFGGSSVGGQTPIQLNAKSDGVTALPFVIGWRNRDSPATGDPQQYITLAVIQNSGGNLNVIHAELHAIRIF